MLDRARHGRPSRRRPGLDLPASRPLVGRSSVVATATELLRRERLVTLLGPGGVGKTSIANHVAARRVAEHGDSVCFVDLAVIPTGALVAAAVGTSFGMRADPTGLNTSDVIEFLGERSVLLYLDTCEHVIDAVAEFVDQVLAVCPNVTCWRPVASRCRTRDERIVDVLPLTVEESAELFIARAGVGGDLAEAGYDADVIAEICRHLDGLAARHRAGVGASADVGTGAAAGADASARGVASRPPRSSTSVTARWRRRSVGVTTCSTPTSSNCSAGCRCSGADSRPTRQPWCARTARDPPTIADDLDALVSRSLLTADRFHQQHRFRLLDTVAVFAAKRLAETGEVDTIRRRHLQHMIDWSRATRKELEGPNPAPALATLVAEEANIRAAYQTCLDLDDTSSLVDIVGALGPFGLGTSGIVPEADEWIEKALAVKDVEPRQRLDVLLLAAWYLDLGKERQVETATEALRLAEDCGDAAAEVFALGCLCSPGDQIEVDAHLQRALSLADEADRPVYVAWPAQVYLNVLLRRHDIRGAADLLDRILADGSQQYGFLEGALLYQRARRSLSIGDFSTAEEQYADAMTAGLRTASPFAVSYAHIRSRPARPRPRRPESSAGARTNRHSRSASAGRSPGSVHGPDQPGPDLRPARRPSGRTRTRQAHGGVVQEEQQHAGCRQPHARGRSDRRSRRPPPRRRHQTGGRGRTVRRRRHPLMVRTRSLTTSRRAPPLMTTPDNSYGKRSPHLRAGTMNLSDVLPIVHATHWARLTCASRSRLWRWRTTAGSTRSSSTWLPLTTTRSSPSGREPPAGR